MEICQHFTSWFSWGGNLNVDSYKVRQYKRGEVYAGKSAFGIQQLSPVPKHSGTGLGFLIPVPGWFRHWQFVSFRYRNDQMPDSPASRHKKLYKLRKRNTLHVYTAGGVEAYTLQVHTAGIYRNVWPLLFILLYDSDKSLVDAGIPECRKKFSPASAFLPGCLLF